MKRVCAFFGHRDLCCDISEQLESAIHTAISECGISSFWCGNYGAFDLAAAHAVRRIKHHYPHIELLWVRAYMPAVHESVNTLYDGSVYPDNLETVPKCFAIAKRNEWIIANCDMIIAYVNSRYGGAYTACHHYMRTRKSIINLGSLDDI